MASFESLQSSSSTDRIVIVGGGIVGCALAFYLSKFKKELGEKQIIVLDKSFSPLLGSTTYAPGFVGQLNESAVLTSLAKATVREYLGIAGAFDTIGGLELASTSAGAETLKQRQQLARQAGLPAELITGDDAAALAADFIKPESVLSALHFPSDGTANASIITTYFRQYAEDQGAQFVEAAVQGLELDEHGGAVTGILTPKGVLQTGPKNPVILATGIWTETLLSSSSVIGAPPIPIIPVAHPYTFTPNRPPRQLSKPYPFVRWPEAHGYARDHGDRDGFGSYNHRPFRADSLGGSDSAVGNWPEAFETALAEGTKTCLKNSHEFLTRGDDKSSDPATALHGPFNGIFSMTPDNLPFAGRFNKPATKNLWLCAAVWVTHAAGTAALITREIVRDQTGSRVGGDDAEDDALLKALDPDRFAGGDQAVLAQQALSRYNDIYNSQPID